MMRWIARITSLITSLWVMAMVFMVLFESETQLRRLDYLVAWWFWLGAICLVAQGIAEYCDEQHP
jgi:hypothetical protein